MKIRKIGVFNGAEVTDLDLTKPLNDDVVVALEQSHAPASRVTIRIFTSKAPRSGE